MNNKVIAVAHQKGGVGKSTIAANLAVYLNAAAIDLDYQQSITMFAEHRQRAGLKPIKVFSAKTKEDLERIFNAESGAIVIDCGGFDSDVNRLAIIAADLVLTPVGASGIELHGLIRFEKILKKIGGVTARVLINRVHHAANSSIEALKREIEQTETLKPLQSVLRDRADFQRGYEAGKSVGELSPNSAAHKEALGLAKEIELLLK